MEKFVYKIRHKKTGLFSTGGMSPKWTTKGKTWSAFNHIKTHLRQFTRYTTENKDDGIMSTKVSFDKNLIPKDWEVVKIKIVESEIVVMNAHELYPERIDEKIG
ncbi:MAG: hypothetical protein JETCAE03_34560 [Ignavibacteriaceae bacterium]|jgi:hypothetical protein|nr:MAG: hypothetical protein JETCAE03_34560 [Ignavibacteriaceae bacterium]